MRPSVLVFTPLTLLATVTVLAVILVQDSEETIAADSSSKIRKSKRAVINSGEKVCHDKRVLIISFDGFRWNYLERTETPNFDQFIRNGVRARYGLTNAFITNTFPNQFTLATGLWVESHNVVANRMYDPLLNKYFKPSNRSANQDTAWYDTGGEPVWVTNQLKGTGHSGVIMWVGCEAPIHNTFPTKYLPFQFDYRNETKIETIISWFKEDCQMNLGMIYFLQPDLYGHDFGPDSEEVTRMIGGLDDLVGYLLSRLEEENLLESTNIILTSDHGFTTTPKENWINLDDFIDPQTRYISDITPVAAIWPHPGYLEEIYSNLTAAAAENGRFVVYKKKDIPDRFHYKFSRRIAPIIVVAKKSYSLTASEFDGMEDLGDHGYDNSIQDMHPFFLAMGPDFKSGFAVDSFNNVDVYPLMCHLLKVEPSPNNGTMDIVSNLLKESSPGTNPWNKTEYLVLLIIGVCLLAFAMIIATFFLHRHFRAKKHKSWTSSDYKFFL